MFVHTDMQAITILIDYVFGGMPPQLQSSVVLNIFGKSSLDDQRPVISTLQA